MRTFYQRYIDRGIGNSELQYYTVYKRDSAYIVVIQYLRHVFFQVSATSGIEAVPFDFATCVPKHLICHFPHWHEAPLRQRNESYSGSSESFQSLCYYIFDFINTLRDPIPFIRAAFNSITAEHCNSWITDSGYN